MSKAGEKLTGLVNRNNTCIVLLHNTDKLHKAKSILRNGFKFESQLTYSTDRINPNDIVEINYFLVERKEYGDFTIVMEIDKEIMRRYSALAESANLNFEDIFTIEEPYLSDNDEMVYTLSHYYIKCILNNKTGEVCENPVFDPGFDSLIYTDNFNRLKR